MREVFYGVISQGVAPYFLPMNEKICTFFGHRKIDTTEKLRNTVKHEILNAINCGCRVFYFGGYGEFDALCFNTVTDIKKEYPHFVLKLIYCVPRENQLRKRTRYFTPESFDDVVYLQPRFEGWYKSIYFRNCAMVDESSYIIFYTEERNDSGAYKTYKYAHRQAKSKTVVNLFNTNCVQEIHTAT